MNNIALIRLGLTVVTLLFCNSSNISISQNKIQYYKNSTVINEINYIDKDHPVKKVFNNKTALFYQLPCIYNDINLILINNYIIHEDHYSSIAFYDDKGYIVKELDRFKGKIIYSPSCNSFISLNRSLQSHEIRLDFINLTGQISNSHFIGYSDCLIHKYSYDSNYIIFQISYFDENTQKYKGRYFLFDKDGNIVDIFFAELGCGAISNIEFKNNLIIIIISGYKIDNQSKSSVYIYNITDKSLIKKEYNRTIFSRIYDKLDNIIKIHDKSVSIKTDDGYNIDIKIK